MDGDGIFKEQGRSVKFFIQKDLNEEVANDLAVQITANGGSVEDKVPLQGFVLVDPTSGEGKRLYACWSTTDRPLRYFVTPTFVPASLQAGRIIPQPFRDSVRAERRRIHIHKSIKNERMIDLLTSRIWNSGGDPSATEEEADVVVAEENNPVFQDLVFCYDHIRDKFVETPTWVNECVESGIYQNTPSVKKNLGGRVKGSSRTEFSESDDKHLAQYIGSRLPDLSMRGRTGNKIYQDLCSRTDLYPWSERHPWQSWRERYKNNTARFNPLIEFFVKRNPVAPDGKGLHGYVRASKSPAKSSQNSQKPASGSQAEAKLPAEDQEWAGSQWEIREGRRSPPAWGKGKRKAEEPQHSPEKRRRKDTHVESGGAQGPPARLLSPDPDKEKEKEKEGDSLEIIGPRIIAETTQEAKLECPDAANLPSHTRSPHTDGDAEMNIVEASLEPASQTLHDSDDSSIGNETQELLSAHRELLAGTHFPEQPPEVGGQTQKLTNFLIPQSQRQKAEIHTADDLVLKAPDPGQALVQIACKYCFVLEEVKEVYEEQKCDLQRTIAFFEEARQHLLDKRTTWRLIAGRVPQEPEEVA